MKHLKALLTLHGIDNVSLYEHSAFKRFSYKISAQDPHRRFMLLTYNSLIACRIVYRINHVHLLSHYTLYKLCIFRLH